MSMEQFDPWDEHTYETDVFHYTTQQFLTLKRATLASVIISVISSTAIVIAYSYMFAYHRKEANRISLRCVFLCCLADLVNGIMNIIATAIPAGGRFCTATSLLIEFATIINACLLTLVGVNLVLIFVFHVKRKHLLERFYYTSVIIYAFASESVSIYTDVTESPPSPEQYSCWYKIYIVDRTVDTFSWMWYYGSIFLVNFIAISCSVLAMAKLLREQKALARNMKSDGGSTTFDSKERQEDAVRKRQNSVLSTVILRCILYPLVPFLVNIPGFVLQLMITVDNDPVYGLSLLDVISTNIGGFFVAVVFFTDPAIRSVCGSAYEGWVEKYVEEYTLVPRDSVEEYINPRQNSYSPLDSCNTSFADYHQQNPIIIQLPSPALMSQQQTYKNSLSDNKLARLYHDAPHSIHNRSNHYQKMTPMRRLFIETHQSKNRHSGLKHDSITSLTPAVTRSSYVSEVRQRQALKQVYIPYRFPWLAKFNHKLLRMLGAKKRSVTMNNGINSTQTSCDYDREDFSIPYRDTSELSNMEREVLTTGSSSIVDHNNKNNNNCL